MILVFYECSLFYLDLRMEDICMKSSKGGVIIKWSICHCKMSALMTIL